MLTAWLRRQGYAVVR